MLYNPKYWGMLGIAPADQKDLVQLIERARFVMHGLCPPSFVSLEEATVTCLSDFQELRQKYWLEDFTKPLPWEPTPLDAYAGLELIRGHLSSQRNVVGLTGSPGVGKSTILYLLEEEGYTIIDEFWEEGSLANGPSFADKKADLAVKLRQGRSIIVAAAMLDADVATHRVHCTATADHRRENLRRRASWGPPTDMMRVNAYDLAQNIDFFRYDVQRMDADAVIDVTTMKLY